MKLVFINSDHSHSKMLSLSHWNIGLLVLCMTLLPLAAGIWVGQFTSKQVVITPEALAVIERQDKLKPSSAAVTPIATPAESAPSKVLSKHQINYLAAKVASLQAQVLRLNVLGEQMAEVANVDKSEFLFETIPGGIGGPTEDDVLMPFTPENLAQPDSEVRLEAKKP